jgi:hypothetical protein
MLHSMHTLTKGDLATEAALIALGSLAAPALDKHGIVTFYLDAEGDIIFLPPEEYRCDLMNEDEAIQSLLSLGYTDDQLVEYLKGRELRRNV